ncbi:PIN domain-containing protein [Streptomyces sp. LP05-1]|uniref:Ribonuclease VapC n=1 Tax=Streptomyces pyxinae TaxID=2970734 RepID=A0ABT2CNZ3_9ACTN|nr:PIN domain-containing protein [Streptomyces sp. LP05-1]MCS0639158.1 PIN domain-containing protein [Streptomyces sp. LP05-1]
MLRYVIDSTAVWRIQRDQRLSEAWGHETDEGNIGSCRPQRTEFRRSARDLDEYEAMTDMFGDLYPAVPVPKNAWQWIETAQYRLAQRGRHQSLSVVDWMLCATAAHHGLVILHDDKDFPVAAGLLSGVAEHNVHLVPR